MNVKTISNFREEVRSWYSANFKNLIKIPRVFNPRKFMDENERMIRELAERYGFTSERVFSALRKVPREKFAPRYRGIAYDDRPIDIGYGQTISQPYTVAFMTHLLVSSSARSGRNINDWRVLEIGTGSGYQAAVLAELAKEVYTIEIIPELANKARKVLKKLGYKNVHVKIGSGEWGWPEEAQFDAVVITAAVEDKIPQELFDQLKDSGVLVAPVGKGSDKVMTKFTKRGRKIQKKEFGIFHFVPFVEESN